MDGLAEDADVVFLLTTNRADLLEPALAERPGRVDQAVALEMPDLEGRRRLFALYRAGLDVDESRLDSVLDRTDGVRPRSSRSCSAGPPYWRPKRRRRAASRPVPST